jgi:hypothetical protein
MDPGASRSRPVLELGGNRLQGHRSRSPDPLKIRSSYPAVEASLGAVVEHCELGERGLGTIMAALSAIIRRACWRERPTV